MHCPRLLAVLLLSASAAAQPCGTDWIPLPPAPTLDWAIHGMCVWDPDGPGPMGEVLLAAGNFQSVGATPLNFVGMYDGASWSPLGSGVNGTTYVVATFDPDGKGPALAEPILGGIFTESAGAPINRIARWNGSAWHPLGAGVSGSALASVEDLFVHLGELIVGGVFFSAGGLPVQHVAAWTGSGWRSWPIFDVFPHEFASYRGELIMATQYFVPNYGPSGVVRWTGSSWAPIGRNHPTDSADALTVYNGELIAGGFFSNITGNPANPGDHIAAWDGTKWYALGSGINGFVRTLTTFDPDGPGPLPNLLIAGGSFNVAGGQPAFGIAAWDGNSWMPLGSGMNGTVRALCVYKGQLYVGGYFTTAGGQSSPYFARWGCPTATCYPDCNADGFLNLADFGCFQNKFALGNMAADCNNDGLLNLADFGCFQTKFALGCP